MWLLDLFGSGSGNLKSQNLKSVPPCACFHGFFSRVLGFPVTMLDTLLKILPKGQIISKGLFGVLEFSQKTNKRIHRSSKNEFVSSRRAKVLFKLSDL